MTVFFFCHGLWVSKPHVFKGKHSVDSGNSPPKIFYFASDSIAINKDVNVRLYVRWGPPSDQIALLNISK